MVYLGITGTASNFNLNCLYFNIQSQIPYTINELSTDIIPNCDATVGLNMQLSDFQTNFGFISDIEMVNGLHSQQNLLGFFSNIAAAFSGIADGFGISGSDQNNILNKASLIALTVTPNNAICIGDSYDNWCLKTPNLNNVLSVVGGLNLEAGANGSIECINTTYFMPNIYESEQSYQIFNSCLGTSIFCNADSANASLMLNINNSLISKINNNQSIINNGPSFYPSYNNISKMTLYDSINASDSTSLTLPQLIFEQMVGLNDGRFGDMPNIQILNNYTNDANDPIYLYKMPFIAGDILNITCTISSFSGQGLIVDLNGPNYTPDYTFNIIIKLVDSNI